MALPTPEASAPTPQELFDRLAQLATEMTETCARVEDSFAQAPAEPNQDHTAFQDLDRMTQNLAEVSKLLARISLANARIPATDLLAAIEQISLPSLKAFIADGIAQTERGDVDLF